jgi:hypothetical protein
MQQLVYLDSNDFSYLSAPQEQLRKEYRTVLEFLRERKRDETVKFFMSAVHLSEAVHAAETHKEAAVRRAELMRELCGSNILRFPTELPELELKRALQGDKAVSLSIDEITSKEGEWFGVDVPIDGMDERRIRLRREVDALLDKLPRRTRRKLRSELDPQKSSSYDKWRELLTSGARSVPIEFPFSLLGQNTAIDWLLGKITNAEFRGRTLKITRNPYIMFKYLLDETKIRQELYEALRKQGRDMAAQVELSAQQIIAALSPFVTSQIEPRLDAKIDELCSASETLRRIISSFHVRVDTVGDEELRSIVESCPSLFVFTAAIKNKFRSRAFSYLSRIRGGNTLVKEEKPSDFGDFMHCFYAPYFDVFRCDASFSEVLKSHKPVRSKIAGRIGDLVRILSDGAAARCDVA